MIIGSGHRFCVMRTVIELVRYKVKDDIIIVFRVIGKYYNEMSMVLFCAERDFKWVMSF